MYLFFLIQNHQLLKFNMNDLEYMGISHCVLFPLITPSNSNTVPPTYIGLFRINSSFFSKITTKFLPNFLCPMHVGLEAYLIKNFSLVVILVLIFFSYFP